MWAPAIVGTLGPRSPHSAGMKVAARRRTLCTASGSPVASVTSWPTAHRQLSASAWRLAPSRAGRFRRTSPPVLSDRGPCAARNVCKTTRPAHLPVRRRAVGLTPATEWRLNRGTDDQAVVRSCRACVRVPTPPQAHQVCSARRAQALPSHPCRSLPHCGRGNISPPAQDGPTAPCPPRDVLACRFGPPRGVDLFRSATRTVTAAVSEYQKVEHILQMPKSGPEASPCEPGSHHRR